MRRFRAFLASETGRGLVSALAVLYMRLVYATNRWQRVGGETFERLLAAERRVVICFWHGRLMMMPFGRRKPPRPYAVMISGHCDGLIIAGVVARFGIGVVRGSSSRQPARALRQAARLCRQGSLLCITPDGPRGPRMRAAPGAVMTAELAHAVILPVAYAATRRWMLRSWDRFLVPLPFGRGVFVAGEAIEAPGRLDEAGREALRLRLEAALNAVTAEADRLTGHDPIEPAPARRAAPPPAAIQA
jgi:lysophospholipid acyltransferase (LPLAT)-like uncharacterized protein